MQQDHMILSSGSIIDANNYNVDVYCATPTYITSSNHEFVVRSTNSPSSDPPSIPLPLLQRQATLINIDHDPSHLPPPPLCDSLRTILCPSIRRACGEASFEEVMAKIAKFCPLITEGIVEKLHISRTSRYATLPELRGLVICDICSSIPDELEKTTDIACAIKELGWVNTRAIFLFIQDDGSIAGLFVFRGSCGLVTIHDKFYDQFDPHENPLASTKEFLSKIDKLVVDESI